MSKLIAIVLLFTLFTDTALANPDCELLLLSPQQQSDAFYRELDLLTKDSQQLNRMYLRVRAGILKSRILRECTQNGGCTNAQIANAVREVIAKDSSSSNALGYGFLVGGIIANAATSAGITVWVNPSSTFFPTFVGFVLGQATFIGASLLSPFSEPISAKIRRFSFALMGSGQSQLSQSVNSELEAIADSIHSTYTLREQYAIDRIFLFRNAVRLNFQAAALAMNENNREAVVSELADAAMNGFLYFKDIDPREPAIINSIQSSFLSKIEDPASLKDAVVELIRLKGLYSDIAAQTYYQKALNSWLGVN